MKEWIAFSMQMVKEWDVEFSQSLEPHPEHQEAWKGSLTVIVPSDVDHTDRINRAISHAMHDIQREYGFDSAGFNPPPNSPNGFQ